MRHDKSLLHQSLMTLLIRNLECHHFVLLRTWPRMPLRSSSLATTTMWYVQVSYMRIFLCSLSLQSLLIGDNSLDKALQWKLVCDFMLLLPVFIMERAHFCHHWKRKGVHDIHFIFQAFELFKSCIAVSLTSTHPVIAGQCEPPLQGQCTRGEEH